MVREIQWLCNLVCVRVKDAHQLGIIHIAQRSTTVQRRTSSAAEKHDVEALQQLLTNMQVENQQGDMFFELVLHMLSLVSISTLRVRRHKLCSITGSQT